MNIRSKKFQNEINFVLLGAKSTGKTVFLTTIYGDSNSVSPLGSPTLKYLENKWEKLKKQEKLSPTGAGALKILKFFYQSEDFGRVEFAIDDYDGNFTETASKIEDDEQKDLNISKDAKSVVDKHLGARKDLLDRVHVSQGIMFFLPYETDELDSLEVFASEVSVFINLAHFNKQSKSHIPASIVVTKWDESEYFGTDDEDKRVLEYIENNAHLNKAYTLIKSNFENVNIVPVSAYEKYNLLKPIEFSLKHTFDKWYKVVKEYESKKEDDKLIRFLTKWYESINIDTLNEKYPFNDIYKEVQKRYVHDIKQHLKKKETLVDKEEYLNTVVDLYKTEKKLLVPLKEEIEHAKREEKRNKFLIKLSAIVGISAVVFFGLGFYKKFKVDESYGHIITKADQNTTSYQDIKEEIEYFMSSHDPRNFIYVFSGLVEKRSNIQKLGVKLESRDKKNVEHSIAKIISDQTLAPDEKQRELNNLFIYSTGIQKINLEQIISNIKNENLTKVWKEEVERCLNVCKDENDISTIENLRSQVKNSENIIHDKEVEEKISALSKREKKIKDGVDFDKLYGTIFQLNSLSKIKKFLNDNRGKINYHDQQIRTAIISQIITVNEDYYNTVVGKDLLNKLKTINDIKVVIDYIDNDLRKYIKREKTYNAILTSIDKTENYVEFKNIEYTDYDNFEEYKQTNIKSKIEKKLLGSLKDIIVNIPSQADMNELEKSKETISNIENFSVLLGSDEYKFEMSDKPMETKVSELGQRIKNLKTLKKEGISGIKVHLERINENTLGFGCGSFWDLGSDPQITIKGFEGSSLSYDNDDSKCNENNVLVFENKVHLRKGTISLDIESHSGDNKTIIEFITVSLEHLEQLKDSNNSDPVEIDIDNDNLKLVFSKK